MKNWIGLIILFFIGTQYTFATNSHVETVTQSNSAIIIGIIMIVVIVLILFRRQKRRFND